MADSTAEDQAAEIALKRLIEGLQSIVGDVRRPLQPFGSSTMDFDPSAANDCYEPCVDRRRLGRE